MQLSCNEWIFAFDCSLFQTVNKLVLFMFFFLKAAVLSDF